MFVVVVTDVDDTDDERRDDLREATGARGKRASEVVRGANERDGIGWGSRSGVQYTIGRCNVVGNI